MKKIIFILFAISLFHGFATGQWIQQASSTTTHLLDCDFINQNTGWVCGDGGVILKTTNGGLNWVQQNSGVNKRLEGIEAVDANILYCVGWFQTILKSTDGGANWVIIRDGPTGTGSTFFKCFFLNSNTGWLLRSGASGGYILRTTNGGLTFDSTNVIFSFLRDIYFKNALSGVLCGDGALVMRSTDGGVVWSQIQLPLFQGGMPNLFRISFVGDYGWTIGEGGPFNGGRAVWRTTNFGSTWDSIARVPYPSNQLNYSVFFTNFNTGYCGGTYGYTYKSTNGGFNWYQQNMPIDGFRNDFWFANDSLGWVIGGGGYILNTTNGGTFVAVQPISYALPKEFKLHQNYPNPFNTQTAIEFEILNRAHYKLEIYDVLGKKIVELVNEYFNSGRYRINFNANQLSSGIYCYKLSSDKLTQTKKFILIK